jgi:hypothetical protein
MVFAAAGAVALIVVSLIVLATGGHGSTTATRATTATSATTAPSATAPAAVQPVAAGTLPAPLDAALRQLEQAVRK